MANTEKCILVSTTQNVEILMLINILLNVIQLFLFYLLTNIFFTCDCILHAPMPPVKNSYKKMPPPPPLKFLDPLLILIRADLFHKRYAIFPLTFDPIVSG